MYYTGENKFLRRGGKMNKIFVYGTLQRNFCNHIVMDNARGKFIAEGRTEKKFPLFQRGIPFLHHIEGQGHRVWGELYDVLNVSVLDRLEGHPDWYRRVEVSVIDKEGCKHIAEAYFMASTLYADSNIMEDLVDSYNHEPIERYERGYRN